MKRTHLDRALHKTQYNKNRKYWHGYYLPCEVLALVEAGALTNGNYWVVESAQQHKDLGEATKLCFDFTPKTNSILAQRLGELFND